MGKVLFVVVFYWTVPTNTNLVTKEPQYTSEEHQSCLERKGHYCCLLFFTTWRKTFCKSF